MEITQSIKNLSIRKDIIELEDQLRKFPEHFEGDSDICPVTHSFADGIYVREIFIPKGFIIVGKIHKHSHPNFLMSGEVDVVTESGGLERLKAPCAMISAAGTKRALIAITDLVWITCHTNPTNTEDLNKLEDYVIAPSFEKYEKFIERKNKKKLLMNKKNIE
jgi:hypothetical protein